MTGIFNKETDSVLAAMRDAGVAETRENYLYFAYAGDPPDGELDPEVEETLPVQFRRETLDTNLESGKIQ
jgi:hypothetical protein